MINTDIAGRPYQIQAICSVLERVVKKHRKFLLVMVAGTGQLFGCEDGLPTFAYSYELANILKEHYPHVTEYILQEIYDNKSAKFIQLIKHILGIEEMATYTETVSVAFDDFLREHNTFGEKQIQFILTLKAFILQRGSVEKKDLIHAPFTQLHPQGIRGIFPTGEIEEIFGFIQEIGA